MNTFFAFALAIKGALNHVDFVTITKIVFLPVGISYQRWYALEL